MAWAVTSTTSFQTNGSGFVSWEFAVTSKRLSFVLLHPTPPFKETTEVKRKPNVSLWGENQRPFPTNAWWTPACLEKGQWRIHPLPYHIQPTLHRAIICYPDYMLSETFVISTFVEQTSVGCEEKLSGYHLSYYDDLCARLKWETEEGQSMECPLLQGSPYFTAVYTNLTPRITSAFSISGNDYNGVFTGYIFRIPLNNGQTWMLYASTDITLKFNTNPCVIIATAPFTGVLRIALVPLHPEGTRLLDSCRNIYPVAGKVHLDIKDNILSFKYEYETESMGRNSQESELLMMGLIHHWELEVDRQVMLPQNKEWYRTIRGPMFGVKGEVWTMTTQIPNITWWDPDQPIDPTKRDIIRGSLFAEATMSVDNTDTYAFSKRLASLGRLAIIADELGETAVAKMIRTRMKGFIGPWLRGENSNPFVYDPFWGGIISQQGTKDKRADFGNGILIGKEDQDWIQKHSTQILSLARDFANPSFQDPYFPKLRHFDFYSCQSWAGGLFCFADGKNQESSSEAVHAYYAISLLGLVLHNPELILIGRALSSLEIISTRNYYHIPDHQESIIYPAPFSHNAVVGILWSGKVDFATWFGTNLEYIHCIQMIPFVPISHKLLQKKWISKVMKQIGHLLSDPEVEASWKGYIWMASAVIDKETAWKGFIALTGPPDLGNSVTNALYWIATRPQAHPT